MHMYKGEVQVHIYKGEVQVHMYKGKVQMHMFYITNYIEIIVATLQYCACASTVNSSPVVSVVLSFCIHGH